MIRFNQPSSDGNPFGNFNSMATNNFNNGTNNFNNAFTTNQPFIEKMDYKNRNNLLHNNVNENTLVEQIIEYTLNIDSEDRSLIAFPNPFYFTVTFGGHGSVTEKKVFVKKNFNQSYTVNESKKETKTIQYDGTPGPIINRKFKNIKYIRIDYLILPRTNIIVENQQNYCLTPLDINKLTYKYKYLLLRINEIKSDTILGTNKNLENDVFILYPDKIMGENHIMWLPTIGTRTYKNSNLENLNKLTFEILTPKGEKIFVLDSNGNHINPNNIENEKIKNCVLDNIQVNIALVLGVVENELNTNTKFDY
jgi:hypothetical protein